MVDAPICPEKAIPYQAGLPPAWKSWNVRLTTFRPGSPEVWVSSSLFYQNPARHLLSLLCRGVEIPDPVLLGELSTLNNTLLTDYLHGRDSHRALFALAAECWYALGRRIGEQAGSLTRMGDRATRRARLSRTGHEAAFLVDTFSLWESVVALPSLRASSPPSTHQAASWPGKPPGHFTSPLTELAEFARKELLPFCDEWVFHGSMADGKITPYSDVDTWMVVSRETLADADRLTACREQVCRAATLLTGIDPLQHHGFFIAAASDLLWYQAGRFPPLLLDGALSVSNARPLTFHCGPDMPARFASAITMARALGQAKPPADAFAVKLLSSRVMILPVLVYQFFEGPAYKPDALEKSRHFFSNRAWEAVERATELRRRWQPPLALPLLAAVDSDFTDHARLLGREALALLQSNPGSDPALAALLSPPPPATPGATDHPAPLTAAEHREAAAGESERIARLPGVRSLYRLGSFDTAIPGISDQDLLIVAREEELRQAPPSTLYRELLTSSRGGRGERERYVAWHEPTIITPGEWLFFRTLWRDQPVHLAGDPLPPGQESRAGALILMYKEGLFQLVKLKELLALPALPLRQALMRSWSITHDISIARRHGGITVPGARSFTEKITTLRRTWFDLPEGERTARCRCLTGRAFDGGCELLGMLARKLKDEGIVSTAPLLPRRELVLATGSLRLLFSSSPTSASADIHLPLAAAPLVYHCRPFSRFEPAIPPAAWENTLHPAWQKTACTIREATARHLALLSTFSRRGNSQSV